MIGDSVAMFGIYPDAVSIVKSDGVVGALCFGHGGRERWLNRKARGTEKYALNSIIEKYS